jgi:predicted enzyme related to lactoylglutathione lyase
MAGRAPIRAALIAGLVGATVAIPALALPIQVPALVDPASAEHHVGKVDFVELVTPDLAAAKAFYGRLFGWTYRDVDGGGVAYAEVSLNGEPIGGMIQRPMSPGPRQQSAWLSFFAVRDADAAASIVRMNGGRILSPPHAVPNRGREAVMTDPQGAVFAVLASSTGDPPDLLADDGGWIWSTLQTSDPDTDAAFYQDVFGYEVFEADPKAEHLILASDGLARASANPLPGNRPDIHPHWLNYIRVQDAKAVAAQVVQLGGRIWVQSHLDRHGGNIAVVADPMGAPFGLLEWPDREREGPVE